MPSAEFVASVLANVAYWTNRLEQTRGHAFTELNPEWPNLLRAVSFGLPLQEARATTITLILAAFQFVEGHGYWGEWLPWLERALRHTADGDLRQRCRLLDQLGHLRRVGWQLDQALAAHQEQEALALELADDKEVAHARFHLSEDYRVLRRYPEAELVGRSALSLFQQLGSLPFQVAAVLNTLGLIALARGDAQLAVQRLTDTVALYRQLEWPIDLARALKNLGLASEARGDVEPALRSYVEAASILDGTSRELDKVKVALSLGTLYFNQGHLEEAEATFRGADSPYLRQSGQTYYQALAANNLGNVLLAQGHLEAAEDQLRRSLGLWAQVKDGLMRANTLGTLGETLGRLGQVAPALAAYDEALDLLKDFPDDAWALKLQSKFAAQREKLLQPAAPAA